MEIITRKEAVAKGLRRYFNGIRCLAKGHLSERFVRGGGCVECFRELRRKAAQGETQD